MQLYHGAHTRFALHIGQCYTADIEIAECYATSRGEVVEVDLDLDGLTVVEVDGYDRDSDYAIGDRECDAVDADVIVYRDEDARGRQHLTYRLMSQAAVDAVVVVEAVECDEGE